MADKKISQLTAVSTPLAGTEVLPIVQNGSTRQVSVNNLTDGRNVTVGAGTVSAPSISPTGDSNTGIFFPAENTIAFAKGGAEAMRIFNTGGVSIGNTTDPGATNLSVTGSIGNGPQQFMFSQAFATWNTTSKLTIPITRVGTNNVVDLLVELDIVFAVSDSSGSAAGAGKFIIEIRHIGNGTPTLMGTITTVHARTISSAWIAYVGTGAGTGQIEITNNGDWNFSGGMNQIRLNMFSGNEGVTVGTISVV